MKYLIIGFCLLLILIAVIILINYLSKAFKGKCCESCKGCKLEGKCEHSTKK